MSETTNAAPYIVTYPINTGPHCVICKEQKEAGITLPYGSRFDGQFVCSDCVRLFIDPLIILATREI